MICPISLAGNSNRNGMVSAALLFGPGTTSILELNLASRSRATSLRSLCSSRNYCPFRKSYPDVLVMQSSQDGNGGNGARSLDRSMQRRIFP